VSKDQWIVDQGSGELIAYPNPYGDITQDEAQAAEVAEQAIIETKRGIELNFLKLSNMLHYFDEQEYYKGRGYPTLRAWAMSPEIELGWRVVQDLLRIRREVLPLLSDEYVDDAVALMLNAGVSKVRAILPLVRDEEHRDVIPELIVDAASMPLRDVQAEVKRLQGQEDPIDKRYPAVFKARVKQGEAYTTVDVSVMDGVTVEPCGKLSMRNRYWPRFEQRFGDFIDFVED
jgi:hypothetical protein